MAAYVLNDSRGSGVEEVFEQDMSIKVDGSVIYLGEAVDRVSVYSLYGIKLASETNVSSIEMNVAPGVYLVEINDGANVITKKVIIK